MKEAVKSGRSDKILLGAVTFSHLAQHFYVGLSVLNPEIMADLNLNYTQLGLVTGTTSIISGFLQMILCPVHLALSFILDET